MTCREVYNRIRWDQRIDSTAIKVGIEDRFQGTVEMDFHDAKLGADVPWHRIQHFSYRGQVIWNRQGLDALDSIISELPTAANAMCQWDPQSQQWLASDQDPQTLSNIKVRLLNLNVLFDLYDHKVPKIEDRFPRLMELLKRQRAELVTLQEVTPKLLSLLLKDPWVRQHYTVSQPAGGPDLVPYGQLLLSRLACKVRYHTLVAGKTILQALFAFKSCPVQLTVVHLYSDRKADSQAKRQAQLDEIQARLRPDHAHWLVGDFNEQGLLAVPGFCDAWSSLHPGDFGFTFDPVTNPLARQTSVRGRRARYDRFLLRGPWTARQIDLVPTDHSDHHALVCELCPPLAENPTHQSALAIIPPEECWPAIQAIRQDHDRSYERWMPHINLLYGFVPESHFSHAQELLQVCLARIPRFRIRLREYRRFYHKTTTTVWLEPECEPSGALRELQAQVQKLFPQCREQSERSDSGYTPHLTVANFRRGRSEPELPPLDVSFEVKDLALIKRGRETPFLVSARAALGSEPLESCLPTVSSTPSLSQEWERRLRELKLEFFPVGSAALELGLPNSDLDLVVIGHPEAEEVYREFPQGRVVSGRVEVLRILDEDGPVDLQYCQYPKDIELKAPELLSKAEFQMLSCQAQSAAQARRDLCQLQDRLKHPLARPLLRVIRLWSKARCLDRQAFGFPGGLAWAILAAWSLSGADKKATLEGLCQRFFLWVEFWPWPQALILNSELTAECEVRERDRFPVFSLTRPCKNVAASVTPGTLEILRQEFRRGADICQQKHWQELLDPLPWTGGLEWPVPLEKKGCLESQVLGFLLRAEREGHWLRPHSWVENATEAKLRILCSAEPPHHLMTL